MSAWMLENKSIAKIAAFLSRELDQCEYPNDDAEKHVVDKIRESGLTPEAALYDMLRDMNIEALKERYGDSCDMAGEYAPFAHYEIHCLELEPLEMFKKIDCYLYQCYEGKVPESALYRTVSRLQNKMMHDYIRGLDGYIDAPWG